ncbi:hypothetical protein RIF29_00771 [Crotalaria pallida]|uniref:leucine--tRNA ligase n=1 Tax=Crotalaria pallida TaxID=3830 RepID=A0AAN9IWJ9_CROPI
MKAFLRGQRVYWGPVDMYVGGGEHVVLHLLFNSIFPFLVLYDIGVVSTKEPFQCLINQGIILGEGSEQQFEIDIKREKGYEVKRMLGDENCLFRAVADQVYGDSELYDLVRQKCINYMFPYFGVLPPWFSGDYYTAHYQTPRQMMCLWDKLQRRTRPQCCNMR